MNRGQYGATAARDAARDAPPLGSPPLAWGWLAAFCLACAATPLPCRSPDACPVGTECLAQRCVPLGAEPVAPGAGRLVLEPADVAVLSAGSRREGGLPATVTFGGAAGDELLVRFGGSWRPHDVVAAFLVLDPATGAEPSADDVQLVVAPAARAWSSRGARTSSARAPAAQALARTRPPTPVRIDVTTLVRELRGNGDAHGFVVRAAGPTARGAAYFTGADGLPPRLDLYLRARPVPPRGADASRAAPAWPAGPSLDPSRPAERAPRRPRAG